MKFIDLDSKKLGRVIKKRDYPDSPVFVEVCEFGGDDVEVSAVYDVRSGRNYLDSGTAELTLSEIEKLLK